MNTKMPYYVSFVIALCYLFLLPIPSWAGIEGEWSVQVIEIVKKFSSSVPDRLKTKIVVEYRYEGGIPPEPFWTAIAASPQALPQTVREYSSPVWDLPEARVYEVCPSQFELLQIGGQTVGRAVRTMEGSVDFRSFSATPFETRGIPSPEVIVHDWGNRYDGLHDVSAMTFGLSLDDLVMSAMWMSQENGRCAGASAAECVDIILASVRSLEPNAEQVEQGIHRGQTFFPCTEK